MIGDDYDFRAKSERLERENTALRQALRGMIAEWDKLTRYGSPLAKAANENLQRAIAALKAVDVSK